MGEINPPGYLQQRTDHSAQNDRLTIGGLIYADGVAGFGDMAITPNGTPNMTVHVAAGTVFITGTENANQGVYTCTNDGDVVLTVTASNPTNPRKDIVIARVRDAFYSGATNAWGLEIVAGTPAASPAEPSLPANSYKLATIDVAANATTVVTGNITNRRVQATSIGGTVICTSSTRPVSPYESLMIYETDTDKVVIWNGAAWVDFVPTGAWTSYTPAWTSSGTAPAIGNGTITGAWTQIGKTIHFRWGMTFGSTTTYGTGSYVVSLPAVGFNTGTIVTFHGQAQDLSANKRYSIIQLQSSGAGTAGLFYPTDTTQGEIGAIGPTLPAPWASTDSMNCSGTYQAL